MEHCCTDKLDSGSRGPERVKKYNMLTNFRNKSKLLINDNRVNEQEN